MVWVWQFRPETGEPGVIPPVTIPYFNAATRAMDAVEIAALPIGYASFYTSQVQTGRFDAAERLAEAGALLAGLARRRRARPVAAARPTPPAPPGRASAAAGRRSGAGGSAAPPGGRPPRPPPAARRDPARGGRGRRPRRRGDLRPGTRFDPAAFRRALRRAA